MRSEPIRDLTCLDCSVVFQHIGRRPAIRCLPCRKKWQAHKVHVCSIKKGRIKTPGVGSGGDQEGEKNSRWKGGVAAYRKYARKGKLVCAICGVTKPSAALCAHHLDHDRSNNDLSNLQLLCKSCHQNVAHPLVRDSHGRYTAEEKLQEKSGIPGRGQSDLKATDNTVVRGND